MLQLTTEELHLQRVTLSIHEFDAVHEQDGLPTSFQSQRIMLTQTKDGITSCSIVVLDVCITGSRQHKLSHFLIGRLAIAGYRQCQQKKNVLLHLYKIKRLMSFPKANNIRAKRQAIPIYSSQTMTFSLGWWPVMAS